MRPGLIVPLSASRWRWIKQNFAVLWRLRKCVGDNDKLFLLSVTLAVTMALIVLRFKFPVLGVLHENLAGGGCG